MRRPHLLLRALFFSGWIASWSPTDAAGPADVGLWQGAKTDPARCWSLQNRPASYHAKAQALQRSGRPGAIEVRDGNIPPANRPANRDEEIGEHAA